MFGGHAAEVMTQCFHDLVEYRSILTDLYCSVLGFVAGFDQTVSRHSQSDKIIVVIIKTVSNVCDSDIGLFLTRYFTSTCIDSECTSFHLCNVAAVVLEMAWK